MLRVILIRPGTTEFDQQGRILGTLDVPLNEQGGAEVADAIESLRQYEMLIVYSSPCESARQTAELVGEKLAIKSKTIDNLKNVDHGLWQGKLVDDVKLKQPKVYRKWKEDPQTVCPPEGEMLNTARERVQTFLSKLLKKHKSGTVGIVAPDPLAGLIDCHLRQTDVREVWKNEAICGSWDLIEVDQPLLTNV